MPDPNLEGKSNEITALPKLLDIIDIEGSIVIIDAMGCQKGIASKCIENNADEKIQKMDSEKAAARSELRSERPSRPSRYQF